MSEKLNEQYFNTRKEHEKNVSPYAWGFIALLLLSFALTVFNTIENESKGKIESIQETEKGLINLLTDAPKTIEPIEIVFDKLGFKIEFHENLKYSRYPNQNFIIAHSLDSVMLSYFIGEIPESIKVGKVEENWKSQLLRGNDSYQFTDSLNFTFLYLKENGVIHKGFYKIEKSEEKYFVIQASVIEKEYKKNFGRMMNVINSFRRIK